MRVVVFCFPAYRFGEFESSFAGAAHRLFFVCCDAPVARGALRFHLMQIYHLIRSAPAHIPRFLWLLLRGRLLLTSQVIDSERVRRFLVRVVPDVGLHAMGVIYRADTIRACRIGILNAHIGKLPMFRGRSVMEWTLLHGEQTGVTVFFLDEGIDTGPRIVLFEPVPIAGFAGIEQAKRHLFAQDARLYRKAVDLVASESGFAVNDLASGARFYEMSALLRGVLADHWTRASHAGRRASTSDEAG